MRLPSSATSLSSSSDASIFLRFSTLACSTETALSKLRHLLVELLRCIHLLKVLHPGLQHGDGAIQAGLCLGILLKRPQGHPYLVVDLGNGPGVCWQHSFPLLEAEFEVLHRLPVVLVLQADLAEADDGGADLSLGNKLLVPCGPGHSLTECVLGHLKHLPGELQVRGVLGIHLLFSVHLLVLRFIFDTHLARFLRQVVNSLALHGRRFFLFGIFVVLVHRILLFLVAFGGSDVDLGEFIELAEVLLQSFSDLIAHLTFLIDGHNIRVLNLNRILCDLLALDVESFKGIP